MKKKIYFYLFIFVSMITLYQFVSTSNMVQAKNKAIEAKQARIEQLEDSVQKITIKSSRVAVLFFGKQ